MQEMTKKVVLVSNDGNWEIELTAKIDTGASRSSIDESIADALGLEPHRFRNFRNAMGKQRRGIAFARFLHNGERKKMEISIANRKGLRYPMIIGRKDLKHYNLDSHTM